MDLEKEVKVTSNIFIVKKKATAVKKLEEKIADITTDDSLLEEMVNEGMSFEIYCKEPLTILARYSEKKFNQKRKSKRNLIKNAKINHET